MCLMTDTAEIMRRFNAAFINHDGSGLADLVHEECVMVTVEPAPEGAKYAGREACVAFWQALAEDHGSQFTPQDVIVAGDRATILWDFRYGSGPADRVSGVNVMRVRDGLIVEALGYSKTPGVGSEQLTTLVQTANA